jgi:hypothetical protein
MGPATFSRRTLAGSVAVAPELRSPAPLVRGAGHRGDLDPNRRESIACERFDLFSSEGPGRWRAHVVIVVDGGDHDQRAGWADEPADVGDRLRAWRVGERLDRDDLDDQVESAQPLAWRIEQVGLDVADLGSGVAVTGDPHGGPGDVEAGCLQAEAGDVLSVSAEAAADDDRLLSVCR